MYINRPHTPIEIKEELSEETFAATLSDKTSV